jgi:hypothetical protein
MTGREIMKSMQILDDLKKRRGYCKFKDKALDGTVLKTRFGRGYGPITRQTTE